MQHVTFDKRQLKLVTLIKNYPPSRSVVSGNTGLTCHLSEQLSLIIEPITAEQSGCDIDSTVLCLIDSLNDRLSMTDLSQNRAILKSIKRPKSAPK